MEKKENTQRGGVIAPLLVNAEKTVLPSPFGIGKKKENRKKKEKTVLNVY